MKAALAVLLAASAVWASSTFAQFSPAAQQVLLLAPQLQAFAGSPENFEALAGGLTNGETVTLTSTSSDGSRQIASFTPAYALAALDTARTLEAARQALIQRGIASPRAGDIAAVLVGGAITTPGGTIALPATIQVRDPKHPLVVLERPFSGSATNYRSLVEGLRLGRTVTLSSSTQTVSFAIPGGARTASEVDETLRLASALLAGQGLYDPTPQQVRAALLGGSVTLPDKRTVSLRGVLEGRARATSSSPARRTSDLPASANPSAAIGPTSASPSGHTSDSIQGEHASDSAQSGHTSDSRTSGHTSDIRISAPPASKK